MKYLLIIFAVVAFIGAAYGDGTGLLFKHMAGNGDSQITPIYNGWDLGASMNTSCDYWLYEEPFDSIYVNSDGHITDSSSTYDDYIPRPMSTMTDWGIRMIAPLYADNYLYSATTAINHVWYRETQDPEMLTKARDAIQPHFTGCGGPEFDPVCVIIVTWQRVSSYCHDLNPNWGLICDGSFLRQSVSQQRDAPPDPEKPSLEDKRDHSAHERDDLPLNGYQLVLATDGTMTFAIFNMHTIDWTCCFENNTSGFSAGDYSRAYDLPGSGTGGVDMLATDSNVGLTGRWIYRVDECEIHDPQCGHRISP